MPRIIITMADSVGSDGVGRPPMLDEPVNTDRLNDDYASLRLLERICWAIEDAEKQERDDAEQKQRDQHHEVEERQQRDRATVGVA
jgi:hypothetical protein